MEDISCTNQIQRCVFRFCLFFILRIFFLSDDGVFPFGRIVSLWLILPNLVFCVRVKLTAKFANHLVLIRALSPRN